jgi:outer membrane receptor protein involved in Fe transport
VRNAGYDLVPETAYTKTFGVVFTPRFIPNLTLSIDRFMIDLEDSIGYNDLNFYVNGCINTADPFYCSGIVRNPDTYTLYSPGSTNPTTGFFRQGTSNFYKGTSHGWDLQAQYSLGLGGAGRVVWDFNGSRPTVAGGQDAPDLPAKNCVGYFGTTCGQSFPKWQHGLRTTYTSADNVFSASFNWRYIGPMTLDTNSNGEGNLGFDADDARQTFNRIEPYNYFDLALTFAIAKRFTLRFAANNLLDKTPPLIANSYGVSLNYNNTVSSRYDALGRNIAVGTSISF